jgi:hypothetical protein
VKHTISLISALSLGLTAFLAPASANAAQDLLEAVPTSWRMQDYMAGGLYVYYTGSPCAQGVLVVPSSATVDSVNRFWSLITTAKSLGKTVGVYFDSTTCNVSSFYLKEG